MIKVYKDNERFLIFDDRGDEVSKYKITSNRKSRREAILEFKERWSIENTKDIIEYVKSEKFVELPQSPIQQIRVKL